jgi:4-hydroxyacetophenone monooxygenase
MATTEAEVRKELLEATDETIAQALEYADPMVLRGILYQLTGDEELVDLELTTVGSGFYTSLGPARDEDAAMIRRKAATFLGAYRDAGAGSVDVGPAERLATSLELASGMELGEDHLGWSIQELGLDPWARSLTWKEPPPADALGEFSVTVIGAGMGGLNAAIQLKRAGIPYRVIEKNSGVGGTWHENRYPGIRVDTFSRFYTHIFGVDFDYGHSFCPGSENRRYLDWVADNFEVRDSITFDTEVSSRWQITIDGPGGEEVFSSNAVVTSVGFLNRPNVPDIEGMDLFQGPSWHTARWPDGFDPAGKRIAVIGTGCSGYQLIAELALLADEVVVFQRRPQWLLPVAGYRHPAPVEVGWLDRNLPLFTNFMRFRMSLAVWAFVRLALLDPEFDDPDAVNALNREQRDSCIAFLEEKLGPELAAKMTPPHPVLSARPVIVDSDWSVLDAIMQNHVTLVTDGIARIDATGVVGADGTHHDVDVIVYATGFQASEYLFPMEVVGRDGRMLRETWAAEGARAYRGMMVPGFPNLWMLYGPNTNGAGLAVPAIQEMSMYFALQCIERLIVEDLRWMEPKDEPFREYNEMIDARNAQMAWSDPRARNYYWTDRGRSATQNPLQPDEMWRLLHDPDFGDLELR